MKTRIEFRLGERFLGWMPSNTPLEEIEASLKRLAEAYGVTRDDFFVGEVVINDIVIDDHWYDADGVWHVEGIVDGVPFEGRAEEGLKSFQWWTEFPASFSPELRKRLAKTLKQRFDETPLNPFMLIDIDPPSCEEVR